MLSLWQSNTWSTPWLEVLLLLWSIMYLAKHSKTLSIIAHICHNIVNTRDDNFVLAWLTWGILCGQWVMMYFSNVILSDQETLWISLCGQWLWRLLCQSSNWIAKYNKIHMLLLYYMHCGSCCFYNNSVKVFGFVRFLVKCSESTEINVTC